MRLPLACTVEYHEGFLSKAESTELFNWICDNCDILEPTDIILEDGTVVHPNVGKIMFVDPELTSFSLLHETHGRRMAWPSVVRSLKDKVERVTSVTFGVCVCLYYKNGESGVGFHVDLPAFGPTSFIPSISLGEQREFVLRRQQDHTEQFALELANGSLLIMGEGCQEEYEHALPVNPKYREPRINLTFRPFRWPSDVRSTAERPADQSDTG